MDKYTPTTEEVREIIIHSDNPRYVYASKSAEFDRWLAELKSEAWDEGYTQGSKDMYDGDFPTHNPYRQEQE